MAVQYIQGNNGIMGTLGSLATLAGTVVPGAQWLTPIGLGMGAMNSSMNGDTLGAAMSMGKLAGMKAPTANPATDNATKMWSPFFHGGWVSNPWQL